MLEAEREALKREAFAASLRLVEQEMEIALRTLTNIGTQAALLVTTAWTLFSLEYMPSILEEPDHAPIAYEMCYFGFSTAASFILVAVVLLSTVIVSLGPGLALQGSDQASMRIAVNKLNRDTRLVMYAFALGIFLYCGSFLSLMWGRLQHVATGVLCTVIVAISAVACTTLWWLLVVRYRVHPRASSTQSSLVAASKLFHIAPPQQSAVATSATASTVQDASSPSSART